MADMKSAPPQPPKDLVPRRDMKPLFDEIGAILEESGTAAKMPGGEGAPTGGPMVSGMSESGSMLKPVPGDSIGGEVGRETEEAPVDVGVIADTLGISMEKAQMLYEAAMAMPKLAGKSPEEIADMLEKDMNLRMQLEKNIGASADMETRKSMSEEGMKAPASPPPMEPTAAPMK